MSVLVIIHKHQQACIQAIQVFSVNVCLRYLFSDTNPEFSEFSAIKLVYGFETV